MFKVIPKMHRGPVAQLVRALVLWAEGRGFEPRRDQYFWYYAPSIISPMAH